VPFDRPFVVTWWRLDYLILPTKYLPNLQRVKPEHASFLKNFSDVSQKKIHQPSPDILSKQAVNVHYSVGKLYESDRMGDIIRKGLKPALRTSFQASCDNQAENLAFLAPLIMEETKRAIKMEIGRPEGTALQAH